MVREGRLSKSGELCVSIRVK